MKIGISSWTYGWQVGVPGHEPPRPLDVFGLLDRAVELGVSCVQIADNLPLHALEASQLNQIITRAGARNIEIQVGARGLKPDHIAAYLNIARQLQSPILRVVIDQGEYQPDEDQIVSVVKEILPNLKEHRIVLAIENHDRFGAAVFARIVERAGSDLVGICLDTTNSFGAGEGVETVLDALLPLTVNLHVKDFAVVRATHNMGFIIEGRPAGRGMLPIRPILEKLRVHGRCNSAILEQWTPPDQDISQTVAREEAWARESIGYLRGLIDQ